MSPLAHIALDVYGTGGGCTALRADSEGLTMLIRIEVNTGNAAFQDSTFELHRILIDLAERSFGNTLSPMWILDANGNTCGSVTVKEN